MHSTADLQPPTLHQDTSREIPAHTPVSRARTAASHIRARGALAGLFVAASLLTACSGSGTNSGNTTDANGESTTDDTGGSTTDDTGTSGDSTAPGTSGRTTGGNTVPGTSGRTTGGNTGAGTSGRTTGGNTGAGTSGRTTGGNTGAETVPGTSGRTIEATALLGHRLTDSVVSNYLIDPDNGCYLGSGNYVCPEAFTEFQLDTSERVHAVIMRGPSASTSIGYPGNLPGGITFADTPEDMVQKLGEPVAGTPAPQGFLKWSGTLDNGTPVELFVDYFNTAPLRVASVKLQMST